MSVKQKSAPTLADHSCPLVRQGVQSVLVLWWSLPWRRPFWTRTSPMGPGYVLAPSSLSTGRWETRGRWAGTPRQKWESSSVECCSNGDVLAWNQAKPSRRLILVLLLAAANANWFCMFSFPYLAIRWHLFTPKTDEKNPTKTHTWTFLPPAESLCEALKASRTLVFRAKQLVCTVVQSNLIKCKLLRHSNTTCDCRPNYKKTNPLICCLGVVLVSSRSTILAVWPHFQVNKFAVNQWRVFKCFFYSVLLV